MFNLVGKRYLFLLISLVVIVPGTISLLVKGLNVVIDFAGGSTVELRPSSDISAPDMKNLLAPLKLANIQVLTGNNTTLPARQVVWVRLNTRVDGNVQQTIISRLRGKYGSQLAVLFDDLSLAKMVTVATITNFQGTTPNISDIQTLLNKLPNTTDVAHSAATPTAIPTPTATATVGKGTPTATAKPKATTTPAAGKSTPTPVAS